MTRYVLAMRLNVHAMKAGDNQKLYEAHTCVCEEPLAQCLPDPPKIKAASAGIIPLRPRVEAMTCRDDERFAVLP